MAMTCTWRPLRVHLTAAHFKDQSGLSFWHVSILEMQPPVLFLAMSYIQPSMYDRKTQCCRRRAAVRCASRAARTTQHVPRRTATHEQLLMWRLLCTRVIDDMVLIIFYLNPRCAHIIWCSVCAVTLFGVNVRGITPQPCVWCNIPADISQLQAHHRCDRRVFM